MYPAIEDIGPQRWRQVECGAGITLRKHSMHMQEKEINMSDV